MEIHAVYMYVSLGFACIPLALAVFTPKTTNCFDRQIMPVGQILFVLKWDGHNYGHSSRLNLSVDLV